MAIGTGTVKLSEIINEFGTNTTYGPNNLRSYLKCGGVVSNSLITTAGTGSVTAPAGATRVRIRIWGAGGEGGDGRWVVAAGEGFPGGGGGSGGYVEKTLSVTGGVTQYFYTVGAGGTGGGNAGAAGGDSSVQDIPYGGTMLLTAGGGGGGGYAGISGDDGAPGTGGITSGGGDLNIVGNEGFNAGGTAPDGGSGAPPNSGSPTVGSAPGGGGGGGFAISGTSYGGTAGGNGGVEFIWYGAGVPEHENNVNIPTSGTVNFSNFRTIGTNVVDKDFESDTYIGQFRTYTSTNYYQIKSGRLTTSGAQMLGLTEALPNSGSLGTPGSIDSIGKSISATGQTFLFDSILDYNVSTIAVIPDKAVLILRGDQRSGNWNSIPWISATVTINNVSKKLYRMNSVLPRGSYSSTYNLTYWMWNDIFGFTNSGAPNSTTNFTFRIATVADSYN